MAAKFAFVALLVVVALAWCQVEARIGPVLSSQLAREVTFIEGAQSKAREAAKTLRKARHCTDPYNTYDPDCTSIKLVHQLELFLAAYDTAYLPMLKAIRELKERPELVNFDNPRALIIELYGQVLAESMKHKSALVQFLETETDRELMSKNMFFMKQIKQLELILVDKYLEISS